MKIDKGKYTFERRRKRTFTPIIYMFAELTLAWLMLSIVNISFQIETWAVWSHIVFIFACIYSVNKTLIVYDRQKEYNPA